MDPWNNQANFNQKINQFNLAPAPSSNSFVTYNQNGLNTASNVQSLPNQLQNRNTNVGLITRSQQLINTLPSNQLQQNIPTSSANQVLGNLVIMSQQPQQQQQIFQTSQNQIRNTRSSQIVSQGQPYIQQNLQTVSAGYGNTQLLQSSTKPIASQPAIPLQQVQQLTGAIQQLNSQVRNTLLVQPVQSTGNMQSQIRGIQPKNNTFLVQPAAGNNQSQSQQGQIRVNQPNNMVLLQSLQSTSNMQSQSPQVQIRGNHPNNNMMVFQPVQSTGMQSQAQQGQIRGNPPNLVIQGYQPRAPTQPQPTAPYSNLSNNQIQATPSPPSIRTSDSIPMKAEKDPANRAQGKLQAFIADLVTSSNKSVYWQEGTKENSFLIELLCYKTLYKEFLLKSNNPILKEQIKQRKSVNETDIAEMQTDTSTNTFKNKILQDFLDKVILETNLKPVRIKKEPGLKDNTSTSTCSTSNQAQNDDLPPPSLVSSYSSIDELIRMSDEAAEPFQSIPEEIPNFTSIVSEQNFMPIQDRKPKVTDVRSLSNVQSPSISPYMPVINNPLVSISPAPLLVTENITDSNTLQVPTNTATPSTEPTNVLPTPKLLTRPVSPNNMCRVELDDQKHISLSLLESKITDKKTKDMVQVKREEIICALSSDLKPDASETAVESKEMSYYWCNFCVFQTNHKGKLVNHVISAHRFSCQYCKFQCYSRADVVQHTVNEHKEAYQLSKDFRYCVLLPDYLKILEKIENVDQESFENELFQSMKSKKSRAQEHEGIFIESDWEEEVLNESHSDSVSGSDHSDASKSSHDSSKNTKSQKKGKKRKIKQAFVESSSEEEEPEKKLLKTKMALTELKEIRKQKESKLKSKSKNKNDSDNSQPSTINLRTRNRPSRGVAETTKVLKELAEYIGEDDEVENDVTEDDDDDDKDEDFVPEMESPRRSKTNESFKIWKSSLNDKKVASASSTTVSATEKLSNLSVVLEDISKTTTNESVSGVPSSSTVASKAGEATTATEASKVTATASSVSTSGSTTGNTKTNKETTSDTAPSKTQTETCDVTSSSTDKPVLLTKYCVHCDFFSEDIQEIKLHVLNKHTDDFLGIWQSAFNYVLLICPRKTCEFYASKIPDYNRHLAWCSVDKNENVTEAVRKTKQYIQYSIEKRIMKSTTLENQRATLSRLFGKSATESNNNSKEQWTVVKEVGISASQVSSSVSPKTATINKNAKEKTANDGKSSTSSNAKPSTSSNTKPSASSNTNNNNKNTKEKTTKDGAADSSGANADDSEEDAYYKCAFCSFKSLGKKCAVRTHSIKNHPDYPLYTINLKAVELGKEGRYVLFCVGAGCQSVAFTSSKEYFDHVKTCKNVKKLDNDIQLNKTNKFVKTTIHRL